MEPNHKYQMVQPKTQTRKTKLPYQDAMMSMSLEKLARETSHTFAKVNIYPKPTPNQNPQPAEKSVVVDISMAALIHLVATETPMENFSDFRSTFQSKPLKHRLANIEIISYFSWSH